MALVNSLTSGSAGGADVVAPTGPRLVEAVRSSLAADDYDPRVGTEQAGAFVGLAASLRTVVEAVDDDDLDRAAGLVNALLDETGVRPRLDRTRTGWDLHFHGPDDGLVNGWRAGCAAGLAIALGSDLAGRLGVCAAPACDRVYLDSSRNAGRRFCSSRCQSRVKAAAHRART